MRANTLILLALLATVRAATATQSVEDLVDQALQANPSVEALDHRVGALQRRTDQVGALPEPTIGIEYSNVPVTAPVPGNHPMSGLQLRLQQTLLAPGTVPRRVAVAEARVCSGQASVEEGRVALAAGVRRAYWRLALARQLRQVTKEHATQVESLMGAVRAAYEVGRAGQHDLLNLQVLRDRLVDDLQDFDRTERELVSAITAAVGSGAALEIETPAQTPPPPLPGDLDDLVERAGADSPTLTRLEATEAAERAAAELARREGWPDLTLWAGYRVRAPVDDLDDGINQATLGVSIPLPTAAARRWGGLQAEHEALARAASADAEATLDDIRADLDGALARWQRASDKAATYREHLIPDARASLDATLSAYQVGQADYASLFGAEVQLLDLQRAERVAETEAVLAEVDVAMLLGTTELPQKGDRP